MRALFFITLSFVLLAVNGQAGMYGDIDLCTIQYVKPGDDFEMDCRSDSALSSRIITPQNSVPDEASLQAVNNALSSEPETTILIKEYQDATKGVHDGFYTCVVHHLGRWSTKECEVVIKDLCEDNECGEHKKCEPDYETGTVECTCDYKCPMVFNVLCSSTCEVFWHECAMEEQTCIDGKEREVLNSGFCPNKVDPVIRQIDQDIDAETGDTVNLSAGLISDGVPMVHISWVFYPENGLPTYLRGTENYEFTFSEETCGKYVATVMHCMNEEEAVVNEYRVRCPVKPTTQPYVTSTAGADNLEIMEPRHVCSLLPGGVLEDFNSRAHFYDLSCTHVLAADFMPGGDYYNPWFIYGTFDEIDGKTALMSVTFYLGRYIFEIQRGWIVVTQDPYNTKVAMEEGVAQELGESGCSVVFAEFHLQVTCPYFVAFYDGLMSGHIKLLSDASTGDFQKGRANMGLCFDSNSGRRKNWQVGKTKGKCVVETEAPACEPSGSCTQSRPPAVFDQAWTACGIGAEGACSELNCDGATPTPQQKCALEQADRINCALKLGMSTDGQGADTSCPDDACEWMQNVADQGCPQDNLPFDCNMP
ncbi:uncharacterized protein LOC134826408 [Bolinopsis microptera]|uniref:uncharacterized protein LOC134826408 n=1 Tax=Bolinopsis microptera TaxID=2820187 RepID=UPI00307962BF